MTCLTLLGPARRARRDPARRSRPSPTPPPLANASCFRIHPSKSDPATLLSASSFEGLEGGPRGRGRRAHRRAPRLARCALCATILRHRLAGANGDGLACSPSPSGSRHSAQLDVDQFWIVSSLITRVLLFAKYSAPRMCSRSIGPRGAGSAAQLTADRTVRCILAFAAQLLRLDT